MHFVPKRLRPVRRFGGWTGLARALKPNSNGTMYLVSSPSQRVWLPNWHHAPLLPALLPLMRLASVSSSVTPSLWALGDHHSQPEGIAVMVADPDHLLRGDAAPPTLPLLPVRNTVLFPGVVLPVTVTRKKSVKLVRKAYAADKLLGVVAQQNPDADEPGTDELHPVGTLARILKLLEQPDGQITIILQGQVRFRIEEQLSFEPLIARVSYFEEVALNPELPAEFGLLQALREAATKVLELTPEIPMEARAMLDGIQSPAFLTHFLSSNVQLDLPAKQKLLELADPEQQARQLLEALLSQAELLEIKQDIRSKTHTGIDAQQREYFLRQQLKTLQDELGQDGPEEDVHRLRARAETKKWPEAVALHFKKEMEKLARINPMAARLLGEHQLRGVSAGPALGRVHQGQVQPQANQENPRRRPFRPRESEGAHPGVHRRAQAEAGPEGAHSVPLRPSRRGQNQPGPQHCQRHGPQVRAHEPGRRARRSRNPRAPQNLRGRHARPHHRPD